MEKRSILMMEETDKCACRGRDFSIARAVTDLSDLGIVKSSFCQVWGRNELFVVVQGGKSAVITP